MNKIKSRRNQVSAEQTRIDFKMVTFTLAGKDYGIDIMKVKEISKATKFTFVPNAAPFVKGVYNLRGDIISVIDLRTFFNLPILETEGAVTENMIVLRLEGHVIAVVVDNIDKVVGIASENVQPPHPLFGDINIKYISGVVENDGRLYIILDVERIFGNDDSTDANEAKSARSAVPDAAEPEIRESTVSTTSVAVQEDVDIGFIEETLITFLNFHSSPVNQDWIHKRFNTWKKQRGDDIQLSNEQDAEAYLSKFASPFSGSFWSGDYAEKIASFLPDTHQGNFSIWNPGCGSGFESYSVACMVKNKLPGVHLKIIAHDNDLIRISTAPGLVVPQSLSGEMYEKYLIESNRGRQFNNEIKDAILFEYHDISHDNTLPKLDMVVMRDTVSHILPDRQKHVFTVLDEAMKRGSTLVLGANEEPVNPDAWEKIENSGVIAYKKK